MSGTLRISITSLKTHLNGRIKKAATMLSDQIPQAEEECDEVIDKIVQLRNLICSSIEKLTQADSAFQKVIAGLTDEKEIEKEQGHYEAAAVGSDGFLDSIQLAEETVSKLNTREKKLMRARQNLSASSVAMSPTREAGVNAEATAQAQSPASNTSSTTHRRRFAVKPPKLDLPAFSGNILEWQEFWTVFDANIHQRDDMTAVEKFTFLKSKLTGSAKNAIDGLLVNNENYEAAIDILTERFDKSEERLITILYGQLKTLAYSGRKVEDQRKTYDACERIFRQMISAGEDVDNSRTLTIDYLSRFPPVAIRELEKDFEISVHSKLGDARSAFSKYLSSLESRTAMINDLHTIRGNDGNKDRPPPQQGGTKPPQRTPNQRQQQGSNRWWESQQSSGNWKSRDGETSSAFPITPRESPPSKCYFCSEDHFNGDCSKYTTANARIARLEELGRCTRCTFKHKGPRCTKDIRCKHCGTEHGHISVLCFKKYPDRGSRAGQRATGNSGGNQSGEGKARSDSQSASGPGSKRQTQDKADSSEISSTAVSMRASANAKTMSLFQTAKVVVVNKATGEAQKLRICLDSLSNHSYITEHAANRLNLPTDSQTHLFVSVFGTKDSVSVPTRTVTFGVKKRNGETMSVSAQTTKIISSGSVLPKEWPDEERAAVNEMYDAGYLSDNPFDENRSMDILIGADYVWDFIIGGKIPLVKSVYMIPTTLGMMLAGKLPVSNPQEISSIALLTFGESRLDGTRREQVEDLSCLLVKSPETDVDAFWKLENIGIVDSPAVSDDEQALKLFNETVEYANQRYYVQWPWIEEKRKRLPSNYEVAHRRFDQISKRLKADPKLMQAYQDILDLQVKRGIIEKLDPPQFESDYQVHYLPHHPVIKPDSATTKIRIVYDASSKAVKTAVSLNECLYRGPVILPDLCKLLIRYRLQKIAILSDIEKAFLQIGLQSSERDVTRFLWFADNEQPASDSNIAVYRFCRVVFGIISSPFLLGATIQHHLAKQNSEFADKLMSEIYVDNVISGADDEKSALLHYKESKRIFEEAGMNLQQFCSNSSALMSVIPDEDRVRNSGGLKVLGLSWDYADSDTLSIAKASLDGKRGELTKRKVLKTAASVFDPLGFFQPVMFKAKRFLQRLWEIGYGWDECISDKLTNEWHELVAEMQLIFDHRIPRSIGSLKNDVTLVVFCDASQNGYGACVYVIMREASKSRSNLIFSKCRLTEGKNSRKLKNLTIPRLELLGMVIGVQIGTFCRDALRTDPRIHVFSDSKCVLYWLRSGDCDSLKRFVYRRIDTIRQIPKCEFRYVRTDENPADYLTKGKSVTDLKTDPLWWHGPAWLTQEVTQWPSDFPVTTEETIAQAEVEKKRVPVFHTCTAVSQNLENPLSINPNTVFSLNKLIRRTATCLIALKILLWAKITVTIRARHSKLSEIFDSVANSLPVDSNTYSTALRMWLKQVQSANFGDVLKSLAESKRHPLIHQLGLTIDSDGVLRSIGRLSNADVRSETRRPVVLPSKCRFTDLAILEAHIETGHGGVSHTLSHLRQKFWVPKGRSRVRAILSHCIVCRKYKSNSYYALPEMPPWPVERVSRSLPFQQVGLDYFGPIRVKVQNEVSKMWVCLFSCLVTRAIHLEPVTDYSSREFLNALIRFVSRRGRPKLIISDNAAQFRLVSILSERAWRRKPTDPAVHEYCAKNGIQWRFITELAPWQGGHYERLVGVVKAVLKTAIGRRFLFWTDLVTMLAETEAIVNSRPITYVGADDDIGSTLRPADFLTGLPLDVSSSNDDFSVAELSEGARVLANLWKQRKRYLDKLWRKWYDLYLLALRERSDSQHRQKRGANEESPSVGEVVLLRDPDVPRGQWKLARVQKVIGNANGRPRTVEIKLPNDVVLRRTVNFLVPLELPLQASDESQAVDPNRSSGATADDEDDFFGFTATDVKRTLDALNRFPVSD